MINSIRCGNIKSMLAAMAQNCNYYVVVTNILVVTNWYVT